MKSGDQSYYDAGCSVARIAHQRNSLNAGNSYQILRSILCDMLGSNTEFLPALDATLKQAIPRLERTVLGSTSGQAELLALCDYLKISYSDAAVDAGLEFAAGLLGLPFPENHKRSRIDSQCSPSSATTPQSSSHQNVASYWQQVAPSNSRNLSFLAALISFLSIGGLVAYVYADSRSSRQYPGPAIPANRDQPRPSPELPPISRLPETDSAQPISQPSSPPVGLVPLNQSSGNDRLASLKPGGVLIASVTEGSDPYAKLAEGALRYNNGNTIRGKFVVNCATGTLDPRDFTFTSETGKLLKAGEYWSPPFKTRWGVEVKLVSEVCDF